MEDKIILAHGSGCKAMRNLIQGLILKYLKNPQLERLNDSALLDLTANRIAFTTDSYTVNPIFFPGSDIGKLAIFGTINDLAVMAARPVYISLSFIIEEGTKIEELERIILSIKEAKEETKVEVVAGDIKVVERGKCDKLFITTSGIGLREYEGLGIEAIEASDKIILNGSIGEHEISVLLSRGEFKFKADILSDCHPLWRVISQLIKKCTKIKFMRDATRGGIGVILNEIIESANFGIEIYEEYIPIRDEIRAICEILGYDPLYLANEGKFILVISEDEESKALNILKKAGYIRASTIGSVIAQDKGKVILNTKLGSKRLIDFPYGTQLPRIC